MNTRLLTSIFACLAGSLFSQTQISGIINHYDKILALDACESRLTVLDGAQFQSGDHVLLIQMKGAEINTANSGSFGDIEELNGAGWYEINEVSSVLGNSVFLKNEMLHSYSSTDDLQLVRIPLYTNVEIVGTLNAKPWDGQSGGVIILEANTIDFQASIDVSGAGYRGAAKVEVASDCNFLTNADDFHYSTTNWRGSPKGEGIAELVQGKEHGRGAQANGGGGGNDHNSGGGGGGNMTLGGKGGNQNVSGFGCDGEYPGRGGKPCPNQQGRIFMGGGGGAGHFDDTNAGSSGGNGGGIVIVIAQTIHGNGHSILANGSKPTVANGDGAGGGGGGGTILLKTNSLIGSLSIEAKGGDGGNVNNTPDRCNGAGGGGSGGHLLTNATNFFDINLEGGVAGVNTVSSSQCNGASNGAQPGENGVQGNLSSIPFAQVAIVPIQVIEQPIDVVSCVGEQVSFDFQVAGNYLEYQWQVNTGAGWENVPLSANYVGSLSFDLTIFNLVPAMDGFKYRCLVTSPCTPDIYSNEVSLNLTDLPNASFDALPLGNGSYQFQNNSQNATSFAWNFGDGNTSTELNPVHNYIDFGNYIVTLSVQGPCGTDEFVFNLNVATLPSANFSFQNTGLCAPQLLQFANLSSANAINFEWVFPGGTPSTSNAINPSVTYNNPGVYDVSLIAFNGVGADTFNLLQAVEIGGPPLADFNFSVSSLTVSFQNLSLNATNGFLWDFGDGITSLEANPVHVYTSQALYQVTLTAFNECGEMVVSQVVPTGALPLADFGADFTNGCHPMTVHFQNQSLGSNLTGFYWEFPGGTPAISLEENPVVTYSQPGLYPVGLTATNSLGSHTTVHQDFVKVNSTPVTEFSFLEDGKTVYFNNSSFGGNNYHWDFGDGNSSQAVNPVHEYQSTGGFTVELTAWNVNCGSAISHDVFLEPSSSSEQPSASTIQVFPNPSSGEFTVQLLHEPTKKMRLKVIDSLGRVYKEAGFQGTQIQVDISNQPKGVYFLQIWQAEEISNFKLLKL